MKYLSRQCLMGITSDSGAMNAATYDCNVESFPRHGVRLYCDWCRFAPRGLKTAQG
jgi:hypothetical protein